MNHSIQLPHGATALKRGLLATLAFLGLVSFVNSARDAYHYGGVDLRDRIVGARAIWAGIDPYQFDWQPGMSERLLNPQRRSPGLTRTCMPPTALLAYGAISWMPYRVARWIAFVLEWSALIVCIVLLARTLRWRDDVYLFASFALFFFVCGSFWRLHVERGQYYAYLTLLLSVGLFLELRGRPAPGYAGIPLGLAIAIRPSFAAMIPILWLWRRRRTASTAAGIAFACVAVTTLAFGTTVWTSYRAAMKEYAQSRTDEFYELHKYGEARPLPTVAEGVDFSKLMDGHTADVTISNALSMVTKQTHFDLSRYAVAASNAAAMAIFLVVAWTCYRSQRAGIGLRSGWALTLAAILNLDFCVPVRYGYSDVLYLPLLALLIPLLRSSRTPTIVVFGIVCAFACGHHGWLLKPVLTGASGTVLRSCLFIGTTTVALLLPRLRRILDDTDIELRQFAHTRCQAA